MGNTSQDFKSPQEILEAFSKKTNELMNGFAADQWSEMMKEFTHAWNSLSAEAMNNPSKWMDIWAKYQQENMNLWLKLIDIQDNKPLVKPAPGDRRFNAKEWQENPIFSYTKQSYLLASEVLMQTVERIDLDEKHQKRLKFYTRYFIDAMSPSNFVHTNPEAMRLAIETKGQSLIDGLKNLLADMEKGRISMTDESAFVLGKNVAITPGAVVYQNHLFQLIQYKPTTENVLDRPLVVVPPSINKFYILDLQPENSFVKYAVDQGNTVFLISWVNPDESLKDVMWDDYISDGVLKAFDVVKEITGAKKINTVSWCVGGTILATALAVMHAKKTQGFIASATFFTTMLDFAEPGDLGVFIDESGISQRESQLKYTSVLSGKDLALAFSMLRANDLIWSYVVSNYLKGQTPPPFDILYWNSDSTNMPAKMYSFYIRNMYLENKLSQPNALTMCDVPINLSAIKTSSYFLSTIDDHIAPWKSTFVGTELFSGHTEFVLGASGHIAGVINPASKNKRNYWIEGELGKGSDHWYNTAKSQPGSWWTHWTAWLKKRGGAEIPALQQLGNEHYPVLEDAPGSYVKRRIDNN